ncbi:ndufs1 NADH-ubiquinone oxidoreductase subunit [Dimargaris verticillata]|uniref:NADH-ubiquinone oxidoreductase 78 kDa subunit, mitochondrial n=1 Tax=Dimargaris verticillata TaxID=2761393 RepID=A0A9W8E7D6_9FUNG|nr:ndufs1 NADH-ubiquinone oxidoreductase subunit [Dimargaris verticillata]
MLHTLAVGRARYALARSIRNAQSSTARLLSTTNARSEKVEIFINNKPVMAEQGEAVIQACEQAGIDIPRFCYHDRLAVAGNCRMCLVEMERSPKPVASCAIPVTAGLKIHTDTPLVHKAREGVMEFLLANHPLDCPICDQGGECDLQDQSMRYGGDRGRFYEPAGKRAVENKNLGPLVKTEMTRCIQCTRCVRFANEVAGAPELGTTGRGNDMQIGTYVEKVLATEMSGNIIDLCPVGALTSKPYSFTARPWELKKTESIDVMDGIGSNIRVDSRGTEVMRILPRLNEDVNTEWISDKTRFAYDGLKRQRLTAPLIRQGDKFVPATWQEALHAVADRLRTTNPAAMQAVAGGLADAESLVALKDLFNRLGSENLTLDGPRGEEAPVLGVDIRANYVLNTTLAGVEHADAVLLVGTNPRHEGAILNTRLRSAYLYNGLEVALVGPRMDLTYDYNHLGDDMSAIDAVFNKGHPFAQKLAAAKRPMVILGSGVAELPNGEYLYRRVADLVNQHKEKFFQPDWNGFNVFHRTAGRVAAMDIGFVPNGQSTHQQSPSSKFMYLLSADDIEPRSIPKDAFVVYQGHHGDVGAHYADVILPGAAYTEKTSTFVNTEGRTQMTRAAVNPPMSAREDWKVIRALSEVAGIPLPYEDLPTLRGRMHEISPTLTRFDTAEPCFFAQLGIDQLAAKTAGAKAGGKSPIPRVVTDYYLTNPITRASSIMAKCSAVFTKAKTDAEALEVSKQAHA